jgi:hypothetical protein
MVIRTMQDQVMVILNQEKSIFHIPHSFCVALSLRPLRLCGLCFDRDNAVTLSPRMS